MKTAKEFIKNYDSKAKEYLSDLDDPLLHQMFENYAKAKAKAFLEEAAEKNIEDLKSIKEELVVRKDGSLETRIFRAVSRIDYALSLIPKEKTTTK